VQLLPYLGRGAKYSTVGAAGTGVKLLMLVLLHDRCGLGCLAATALAVESSMLHNFAWHNRWTWRDRSLVSPAHEIACRLLRFQLSNGSVALLVNLASMPILTNAGLSYAVSGAIATVLGGVVNFLLADHWVFTRALEAGPAQGHEIRH
jgi:putative flippase GtrA